MRAVRTAIAGAVVVASVATGAAAAKTNPSYWIYEGGSSIAVDVGCPVYGDPRPEAAPEGFFQIFRYDNAPVSIRVKSGNFVYEDTWYDPAVVRAIPSVIEGKLRGTLAVTVNGATYKFKACH